jgi:hypothetical protein
MKRVKSFFISLGSFAIASLSALVLTPQFTDFMNWVGASANAKLLGWGIPAVAVIVIGKFIDEIWRSILNKYIIAQRGYTSMRAARRAGYNDLVDLY